MQLCRDSPYDLTRDGNGDLHGHQIGARDPGIHAWGGKRRSFLLLTVLYVCATMCLPEQASTKALL
jgi:hypothetical protein